ncbi:MAG: phage minor capsid protein [Anaerotignum propionicum]|uniref:phage minor capsid protein n=1 Tax=Anaerotignum propionicum TaxID=28446 RepID=UPI002B1EC22A|nr:phage minor capsid protein [Anaerotignum propionicum]MEA5057468.1 phage minor capsid protein [Anaerotignum propionicum]
MLKPKYIEQLPENLIELYSQLEQDILADMARRLSTYDYYIPAAQWQRVKLIELGNFEDWIIKALASRTGMTQEEIKALMEEAGMKALKFDDRIYKAAGLNVPPISASPALLDVINTGIRKTNGLFENLTNTTAGTATKQLENALDRAYMQIISGAFDRETSVRNAIKDLARYGVGAVTYPTGKIDSLETAVRRAIITGVNQTALKLQEARAEQMGSDLVETTAHAGARPSHAEWQGKVFSLSGKSKKYPEFKSSTGYGTGAGLGGWNCRHSFFPYLEGSPRAYTNDELKGYNSKNVEYNGQKMTEYEASLQQRSIERNIRRWKREKKAMEAAGLPTEEASAKISKWQAAQREFIDQTGLKRQYGREQIYTNDVVKSGKDSIINAIQKRIKMGKQPLKIETGKQGKHIIGHKNFIEGRSYLTITIEEAQEIANKYAGNGTVLLDKEGKWKMQEIIETDRIIGIDVDDITDNEMETNKAKIHYSKKGIHIVPYTNTR